MIATRGSQFPAAVLIAVVLTPLLAEGVAAKLVATAGSTELSRLPMQLRRQLAQLWVVHEVKFRLPKEIYTTMH